jgi:hypothetical protein
VIAKTLAVAFLICGALAGSPAGRVRGTVQDTGGGIVPSAVVTLSSPSSGERRSTRPQADGIYEFADVAPGVWDVSAEAPGFKRTTISQVAVHIDRATRADIRLEVGGRTETIEVVAATSLSLDRPTFTTVVESDAIANLPLNGRQYLDLAALASGIVPAPAGTQGSGFNAGGIRSQSNVYLLDGISNIDTQTNQPLNLFRISDAVREFSVQSRAPMPEFGRGAGAQVNVVTKSGTNSLHGSAFEYFRNTALNAADFFTNRVGAPKAALNRNQFGATAGGAIHRDRTFFFGSYEGFRQVAPAVSSTVVPTLEQRASVADPISRRLLDFYPLPNVSGPQNYLSNVRNLDSDDTALVRVDHHAGARDALSARWVEYWGESTVPGATPLSGGNRGPLSQLSAMASHTHTFSAAAVNELRLGLSRYSSNRIVQDAGFDAGTIFTAADGSPLPGVPRFAGLPTITIGGGFAGLGSNVSFPQGRTSNTIELFDNVSWSTGRHAFRWGVHVRREDLARSLDRSSRGSVNFANFADFARAQLNGATLRTGSTQAYWRRHPWAAYFQDEFRLRPDFTLSYGIRYERPSAVYERRGHLTNFVPGYGPMIAGTSQALDIDPAQRGAAAIVYRTVPFKLPRSGVFEDRNNFAPMLGLAYAPRGGKTVVRAGARVAYDDLFNNVPAAMALAPPYNLQTTQTANGTQPAKFAWPIAFDQNVPLVSNAGRQGPGTPTVGALTFQGIAPNLRSAVAYLYHLTIEREAAGVVWQAGYQGSQGRRLGIYIDVNQPFVIVRDPARRGPVAPNEQLFPYNHFGQAQLASSIANSHYDGMVLSARRSSWRGSLFQVSYTYGKSLDYNSAYFGTGNLPGEPGAPIDSRNLRLEHGPSSFDMRHRLVAFFSVPILAGVRFSGVLMAQSGTPFTIVNGGPDTSGFNQSTQGNSPNGGNRPNLVKAGAVPQDNSDPDRAFDPSWFAPNGPGQPGISGRNQYYGPGMQNLNVALDKSFVRRFHVRADVFNLLNHTNFANPVADLNNASFGRITQTLGSATATSVGVSGAPTGGPRVVQLSLRLEF